MTLLLIAASTSFYSPAQNNRHPQFGVFDIVPDVRSFEELDFLGVGWVREQFRLGEGKDDLAIMFYSQIISEGFGLFLTIHHRDETNIKAEDMASFIQSTRGSYPPDDTVKYKNLVSGFVNSLVDEITSQGKSPEDFLIIQFCNEVMPTDIVPDNKTRFWHGTSDEYLNTLKWTFNAVKDQVPHNISVANAGISSAAMEEIVTYDNDPSSADQFQTDVHEFNDRVLRKGKFDWADVHLRHHVDDLADKINWVKERWAGPLTATEFAGPDPRTRIAFSENLQAQELVERMSIALDAGVDRIFWSHLMESTAVDEIYFKEGLLELDTWRRKLAFFAYQEFIDGLVTGLDNDRNAIVFSIYPNPFKESTMLKVEVQARLGDPAFIEFYDLDGRKIEHLQLSYGINEIRFSPPQLRNGVFFYRIFSGKFSQAGKILFRR